jgi:hypothetical protein
MHAWLFEPYTHWHDQRTSTTTSSRADADTGDGAGVAGADSDSHLPLLDNVVLAAPGSSITLTLLTDGPGRAQQSGCLAAAEVLAPRARPFEPFGIE